MATQIHRISRWLIAICLVLSGVLGYVDSVLLDEDAFAERIALALDDPDVRRGLATRTVDIAFDAFDANSVLAEVLPDDVRLAATPALELSKPVVAQAGAELLAVDTVAEGLETAARSVHRQTTAAILADDERDVIVNTRPVLVVTADAIVGPAGARAAVDVGLPDSATSIDLGSNKSPLWATVRGVGYVALAAFLVLLIALAVYFISAKSGTRLVAAARLGRTFMRAGVVVIVLAFVVTVIVGVAVDAALAPGTAIAIGNYSFGGGADNAGVALASILLDPIAGSGRRMIINGLLLLAAANLFGSSELAVAIRALRRSHDPATLIQPLRRAIPGRLRRIGLYINGTLVVLLIGWPQPTLRVVLTLVSLALVAHLGLTIAFGRGSIWAKLRDAFDGRPLSATDETERSTRASAVRRLLWVVSVAAAVVWPDYGLGGVTALALLVGAAFALSYRWELAPQQAVEPEPVETVAVEGWSTRRKVAIAGIAAVGALVLAGPSGDDAILPASASGITMSEPTVCNGLAELCDRTIDEVIFAGTHNSMSASELGWELANHEGAIPAQLAGRVRALLIDVKHWDVDVSLAELNFDPEAAAIASAALAGAEPPQDGLWMCHNLCQLGATPFQDFLADLRVFLETNPDEVLIIVIQDDAPAADIKAAIESADLVPFALDHEPGSSWPTLSEMIQNDTRLVFMAENDADATGWYQLAFDGNVIDTGFQYAIIDDFECSANRGVDASPFFMINHWVETGLPVPDEADAVNSAEILRSRVDECRRVHDRLPSVIAVNFWERGDLIAVVDELNSDAP